MTKLTTNVLFTMQGVDGSILTLSKHGILTYFRPDGRTVRSTAVLSHEELQPFLQAKGDK